MKQVVFCCWIWNIWCSLVCCRFEKLFPQILA